MKLDNLVWADAQIIEINLNLLNLQIILKTWDERKWLIIFEEVLALESYGVEGTDISHMHISNIDNFKSSALQYFTDESSERFLCFSIYGVWSEKPLLKIIATDCYKILENDTIFYIDSENNIS